VRVVRLLAAAIDHSVSPGATTCAAAPKALEAVVRATAISAISVAGMPQRRAGGFPSPMTPASGPPETLLPYASAYVT
jgi:hypothetical protein